MLEIILKLLGKYGHLFISGLGKTLELSALSVGLGLVLGAFVCLIRMSRFKPLVWLCKAYVEIIRGTPILLQLYFFYFSLPKVLPFDIGDYQSIVGALIINCSAYISELIRAGIQAVDHGQTEAARSLGMSASQTMKKVVLPQAIKNILPALGNEFIMEIKQTSLAATFFLGELMTVSRSITAATFLTSEPLIIAGVIYLFVTFTLSKLVGFYERKVRAGD